MNLQPPGYEPDELPIALPRDMVPETGVEPARDRSHGILSPGRLPIPPLRHGWLPVLNAKTEYHSIAVLSRGNFKQFYPIPLGGQAARPAFVEFNLNFSTFLCYNRKVNMFIGPGARQAGGDHQ